MTDLWYQEKVGRNKIINIIIYKFNFNFIKNGYIQTSCFGLNESFLFIYILQIP